MRKLNQEEVRKMLESRGTVLPIVGAISGFNIIQQYAEEKALEKETQINNMIQLYDIVKSGEGLYIGTKHVETIEELIPILTDMLNTPIEEAIKQKYEQKVQEKYKRYSELAELDQNTINELHEILTDKNREIRELKSKLTKLDEPKDSDSDEEEEEIDIATDFKKLTEEVKAASSEAPEDDFLNDILNCIGGMGDE